MLLSLGLSKRTKLDYCQYLLSSPINYTVTNLADHLVGISHEHINRYLHGEKLTPRLLWDNIKPLLQPSENAYVVFDDTVLDKRHSTSIELTRRQYSTVFLGGNNSSQNKPWQWASYPLRHWASKLRVRQWGNWSVLGDWLLPVRPRRRWAKQSWSCSSNAR